MMHSSWILSFLLASLSSCVLIKAQRQTHECNNETLRRCRRNMEEVLGEYGTGSRRLEIEDRCWRMRQNFDCVLFQTSMCLTQEEQERNSDVILKGWRFLDSFCENFKNWWTKDCYQNNKKLKQCETMMGANSRSTDYESCRGYLRFRECATLSIDSECDSDDQRLLGVYLMEKGKQKAWKCPASYRSYSREPVNSPLSSNTREVNLRDRELSDSPSGSSAMCIYNTQKSTQDCLSKFENVQKEARDLIDEDAMEKKVCCGLSSYEDCIFTELEKNCGDDVKKIARQLVSSLKERTHYNCEKVDEATCSGPISATVSLFAIIIGGLLSSFAFTILV